MYYNYQYQIFGSSNTNTSVYNSVNASATAKLYLSPRGSNRLSGAGYYITQQGIRYYNYRWFPISGSYTTSSNALVVTGDTFEIQTPGVYSAAISNGSDIITVNFGGGSSGGVFLGQAISGTGIPAGAYITGYAGSDPALTGRGGNGTYRISANATATNSNVSITATEPAGGNDYAVYYPGQDGYWSRTFTNKSYNSSTGETTLTLNVNVAVDFSGSWLLVYTYGSSDDNAVLTLDKALIGDISSGTQLSIGMSLGYGAERSTNKARMFKSRILDIEQSGTDINLYLTDELPYDFKNATMRHYGFFFVNFGGWTYPKTGGSSFRSNNVLPHATDANSLYIPNRSGRIQPGDTITYSYEDDSVSIYQQPVKRTVESVITSVGSIDGNGFALVTHTNTGTYTVVTDQNGTTETRQNAILYGTYPNKQNWLSLSDIFVSHRTGNFVNNGPVADKFIFSDSGLKMTFGDYRMWYQKWENYIGSPDGITGRAGWVGNFAVSRSGKLTDGLKLEGASAIQWGRQYNSSMWLSATPFTPRWMGWDGDRKNDPSYPPFMAQIQEASSIESLISGKNTNAVYDGVGEYNFYPINHSSLAYGNVYGGLNTSQYLLGSESYDTQQYRWSVGETKLIFGLQDASINAGDGSVSGGNNARITEQLIINSVTHYKPALNFEVSNFEPTGTLTCTSGQTGVSGSGTTFTTDILPGDQLYANEDGTPSWIGTVSSVINDTSITLVSGAAVGNADTTWSVISTRVKKAGTNAPSQSLVFSGGAVSGGFGTNTGNLATNLSTQPGTPGNNVILADKSAWDRYNFKFNINKRTYNQTPLLNTRGELTPVNSVELADNVVRPGMGDLSVYQPAMFNVNVTRFNPKTHIENSVSVVGRQVNI